ncbi:MAG: PEP-CTERM sorting domain-containing protein [Terracidiphilus sp.]
MKKAMFLLAMALLLSKVAAADTTSFNYSGTAPAQVNAGSAMGTYLTTPEQGWTWSAGWGVINPYAGLNSGWVADPATSNYSTGDADAFNYGAADSLTINFSTPESGVSAEVAVLDPDSNAASVELIAYDGAAQIGSSTLQLDLAGGSFESLSVFASSPDISSVTFVGLDSDGNPSSSSQNDVNQYAIADITTVTPEPGTISLLGSGLLGLAGMLKLRRRRA